MKVITGELFNTSFGKMIIPKEQTELFSVGDAVLYHGKKYSILAIVPPTKPNAKWALKVE